VIPKGWIEKLNCKDEGKERLQGNDLNPYHQPSKNMRKGQIHYKDEIAQCSSTPSWHMSRRMFLLEKLLSAGGTAPALGVSN